MRTLMVSVGPSLLSTTALILTGGNASSRVDQGGIRDGKDERVGDCAQDWASGVNEGPPLWPRTSPDLF